MTHWATGLAAGAGLALAHALLRTAGLRRARRKFGSQSACRLLGWAVVRLALVGVVFTFLALSHPSLALPAALGLAGAMFLLLAAPVVSSLTQGRGT